MFFGGFFLESLFWSARGGSIVPDVSAVPVKVNRNAGLAMHVFHDSAG